MQGAVRAGFAPHVVPAHLYFGAIRRRTKLHPRPPCLSHSIVPYSSALLLLVVHLLLLRLQVLITGAERVASLMDALALAEHVSLFGRLIGLAPGTMGLPPPAPPAAPQQQQQQQQQPNTDAGGGGAEVGAPAAQDGAKQEQQEGADREQGSGDAAATGPGGAEAAVAASPAAAPSNASAPAAPAAPAVTVTAMSCLRELQYAAAWPADSPALEELYTALLRFLLSQWVSAGAGS